MNILENFTDTYNSDNRFEFSNDDNTDIIVPGADCDHIFELPFSYRGNISSCLVIYKQGLEVIHTHFVNYNNDVLDDEYSEHPSCKIRVHLTPEITIKFKSTLLNTYAQLKMTTDNEEPELLYGDIHHIWVRKPLDFGRGLLEEEGDL